MTTGRAENNRKKKTEGKQNTNTKWDCKWAGREKAEGGGGGGKDLGTGSTTRSRAGVKQFMAVWEWGGEKGST